MFDDLGNLPKSGSEKSSDRRIVPGATVGIEGAAVGTGGETVATVSVAEPLWRTDAWVGGDSAAGGAAVGGVSCDDAETA
jgi:hypothetical protein